MLSLVWLLILMMMKMMKAGEVIMVHKRSGDSVVLPSGQPRGDVRWTQQNLLLTRRTTRCHHGRCELLSDGSLRFSRLQAEDTGNYTLEVFDEAGNKKEKKVFVLQVTESSSSSSLTISCFLLLFLLLLFIILFILWRRRRSHRTPPSGQAEENVYVVMRGNHGNKGKQEQEESVYVPCSPALPVEQTEDIYV